MIRARDRWLEFRAFVDASPALSEVQFRALVDRLRAEPDGWLRRSCAVHLARSEREVASDDQLRELGAVFGGKVATFVHGILIRRRLRRDPDDAEALRDARAFDQAWLTRVLPT